MMITSSSSSNPLYSFPPLVRMSSLFTSQRSKSSSYSYIPQSIRELIFIFKTKGSKRYVSVSLDLGRFTRCGFFDWKLVKLLETGEINSVYKVHTFHSIIL